MGMVIALQDFLRQKKDRCLQPIVYCCLDESFRECAVSINRPLAQALMAIDYKRRTMYLERCFTEVVQQFPEGTMLKDFDVIFNPNYKVDVLKIMIATCKKTQFSVVWPGTYENGKLFYAEDGYPDYKVFSVEDYDITCIV